MPTSRMKISVCFLSLALIAGCALSHERGGGSVPLLDGGARDSGDVTASDGLAVRACGPTSAAAWLFVVTDRPVDCRVLGSMRPPSGHWTTLLVLDAFTGGATDRTFTLGSDGQLEVCSSDGTCHGATSGSIIVERFTRGEEAVARWSATLDDGTTTEGRARITTFCPSLDCG